MTEAKRSPGARRVTVTKPVDPNATHETVEAGVPADLLNPTTLKEYNASIIARAAGFTVVQPLGRGKRDTRIASTLEEARAVANSMQPERPAMINAVDKAGNAAFVELVNPKGMSS